MKKFHLFSLTFFLVMLFGLFSLSFSQTVTFCESVDASGNPSGSSTVFTIPSGGGYLDVLVNGISNTTHLSYIIYYDGQYSTTLTQDTQTNWAWCWKQITFYDAGNYTIKVYDSSDRFITSGELTIKFN